MFSQLTPICPRIREGHSDNSRHPQRITERKRKNDNRLHIYYFVTLHGYFFVPFTPRSGLRGKDITVKLSQIYLPIIPSILNASNLYKLKGYYSDCQH